MAPTWSTTFAGNATTSTTATNIGGGSGGSIPYQSGASTTLLLANGTAGQILTSAGTTLAPTWSNPSAASQITVQNSNIASTYYPVFVSGAATNADLFADITTNPLSYNPNTGLLTVAGSIVTPNINNGSGTIIIGNVAGSNVEIASASSSSGTIQFCNSNASSQTVNFCNGDNFNGQLNICSRALGGTLNIASGSGSSNSKGGAINFGAGDNTGTMTIGNSSRLVNINASTVTLTGATTIASDNSFTGNVNIGNGTGSSIVNIGLNYAKTGGNINIGTQNGNQTGAGMAGLNTYATAGNSVLLNGRYNTVAAYASEFYSAAYQSILGHTNNTGIVKVNQKIVDALTTVACLGYQLSASANTDSNYTGNVFSPQSNAYPTAGTDNIINVTKVYAPANQISLVCVTVSFTNKIAVSIPRHGFWVSLTQAVNTGTTGSVPAATGLSFYDELNPESSAIAVEKTISVSGVYANSTSADVYLYVNALWNQLYTTINVNSVLIAASITVTKIG